MTQKEKDLLLKDICSRLPYGVKFMIDEMYLTEDMIKGGYNKTQELYGITREGNVELLNMDYHMPVESIRPYLFPISSMTPEQKREYVHIANTCGTIASSQLTGMTTQDWLDKNHFDYRGLIPMGLAEDATHANIY